MTTERNSGTLSGAAEDRGLTGIQRPPTRWLTGIVPPIVTPLTESGSIDVTGLERQCSRLLAGGVGGIFALGTTGEGASLGDSDRLTTVDVIKGTVAGQVPVLVGALDTSPVRITEFIRACDRSGIAGFVCAPPFYGADDPREMIHHFETIAAGARNTPIVAYNIPGATKSTLSVDVVADLARRGVIQGLKDSGGSEYTLRRALAVRSETLDFAVLTGSEVMVDTAIWMGADGAVPGLANVTPGGYVAIFDAAVSGRLDEARRTQEWLIELFEIANVGLDARGGFSAGIGAFKAALHGLGVIATRQLAPPLISLTDREAALVMRHLELAHIDS